MEVRVSNPELERFVAEEVKSGRFPSVEAVVEAGIARLKSDSETELDEATLDALDAAEDQIERGEFHEWESVSKQLRKNYLGE